MKKKLVLVGGNGYIGNYLYDNLRTKFKIKIIDPNIYNQKLLINKNRGVLEADMLSTKSLEIIKECDYVVVLAGLVGDPISNKYKKISFKVNEKKLINLFKKIKKFNLNKLIFVSTCSNYGYSKKIVNEKSLLKPLSPYAKSKVKIEKFLLSKNYNPNFSVTILRFATAFGFSSRMRLDLTVNEFLWHFFYNKKLEVYHGKTWRPYCHVKDFSKIIHKVLNSKDKLINKEVFNAGNSKNNYTKNDIINKIGKFLKKPKISISEANIDPRNYRVSFSKIRKKLKVSPSISMEQGIKEMITNFKKFKKELKNKKNFGNYKISKSSLKKIL